MCSENYRLWSEANRAKVRWTEAELNALGADKGFLPERYWPLSVLAREAVEAQGIGE